MERRIFLRYSTVAALSSELVRGARVEAGPVSSELDRFGGWKSKRFQATGFFRVEKDDRWWLVTPEGHAFLSWGINHLHPDLWKQDYNNW